MFDCKLMTGRNDPMVLLSSVLDFTKTWNGEWRMENREWRMENGEWKRRNGEWEIEILEGKVVSVLLKSAHLRLFR